MKPVWIATIMFFFAYPAFAESNVEAAARDVCKCLEAPYMRINQIMELVNKAQTDGDVSRVTAAQEDMMTIANESSRCFDTLPAKYPEIDQSEELQKKVMALAEKQCPNPAPGVGMNR